jgi:hypothetical protein
LASRGSPYGGSTGFDRLRFLSGDGADDERLFRLLPGRPIRDHGGNLPMDFGIVLRALWQADDAGRNSCREPYRVSGHMLLSKMRKDWRVVKCA